MKTKALLGIGVAIVFAAVIAGAVWWELRSQVITFDDGSELTLMGADYGLHHKSPEIKMPSGILRVRSFDTTNNTLVVWVREKFPDRGWRNFQYYVYDQANTACAATSGTSYSNNHNQNQLVGVQFSAFPRRQGQFYVRVQENGNGGQEMSDDKFVISNPARGPFTALTGDPLPDTEEDGVFSVTLEKLVARAKMSYMRNNDADDTDPINLGAQATFHAQINGTNASNWQPVAIETSDGTGNSVTGWLNAQPQGDDCVATYQYALWTDEPAWKLRVEFSKQSGFDNDELWTVPAIPVQNGRWRDFYNNNGRRNQNSKPFAEEDLGDYHLSIFPVRQFTDMGANAQPQGGLTVEVDPAPPEGMRLTIVKLTDDEGDDIQHWNYGQQGQAVRKGMIYRYGLQDLQGGTNFTLTVAFHKSHFVEFTAKPEVAQSDSSDQSNQ